MYTYSMFGMARCRLWYMKVLNLLHQSTSPAVKKCHNAHIVEAAYAPGLRLVEAIDMEHRPLIGDPHYYIVP
jgi:hypothetical protein